MTATHRLALSIVTILVAGLCMSMCRSAADAQTPVLEAVLVAESDANPCDDAALMHLLARRAAIAHVDVETEARRYSALYRVHRPSQRQQSILSMAGPFARLFARAAEHVARWRAGTLADPCPGAMHFGAPTGDDYRRAVRMHWRPVTCACRTLNRFWRLRQ